MKELHNAYKKTHALQLVHVDSRTCVQSQGNKDVRVNQATVIGTIHWHANVEDLGVFMSIARCQALT